MTVINTLDYYPVVLITGIRSFIVQAPGVHLSIGLRDIHQNGIKHSDTQRKDTEHKDTQHKILGIKTLGIKTLGVKTLSTKTLSIRHSA